MSDFEDGLAIGMTIGRKRFNSRNIPTEEKWQYPNDWLPLPDVSENEVAALVFARAGGEFQVEICGEDSVYPESVDWGDPNGEEHPYKNEHVYSYERGTPYTDSTSMFVLKAHYSQSGQFRHFHVGNDTSHGLIAAISVDGSAIGSSGGSILYNHTSYLQYINILGDITNFENRPSFLFNLTQLKRVDFENSPSKLPTETFCNCSCYSSVNLPNLSKVTSMGHRCFYNCFAMSSINLPMLQSVGTGCFVGNYSLEKIDLPKLQTAESILVNCYDLKNVHLPMLQTIGSNSLSGCSGLEVVNMESLTTVVDNKMGNYCYSLRKVNMPNIDITQSNIFPDSYMIK